MSPLQFRSFRTRIIVLFLGLFTLVQLIGVVTTHIVSQRNAHDQIHSALKVSTDVFTALMEERTGNAIRAARLLSRDSAFKAAYATRHPGTILSALQNHRGRIGADVMKIVALDGKVVADTLRPGTYGARSSIPGLLAAAERSDSGEAASVIMLNGQVYQMVVVPLLAPTVQAWVCVGFAINDHFTAELEKLTSSEVSLMWKQDAKTWVVGASTHPPALRKQLLTEFHRRTWDTNHDISMFLNGEEFITQAVPFGKSVTHQAVAVLQRPLQMALLPFTHLQILLGLLAAGGLVATYIVGLIIARGVTRPVDRLVENVRRIEKGDYDHIVEIHQQDEIGELATALNRMVQGLAERDRVRGLLGREKEFTANVSHELRTPLTSIKTSCELIARDRDLSKESQERLLRIVNAVDRMTELTSSLLLLAREGSPGAVEPVALHECAQEAAKPFLDKAHAKSVAVELEIATDITLHVDRNALYLVLSNLIKNAVQHTEHGTVTVDYAQGRLSVADTGHGIAAEELPYLFQRFYRAPSSKSKITGFGLGLSIVKSVCDHHGWRISVASTLNVGTKITVSIPQQPRETGAPKGLSGIELGGG
jgi:signal transduction histidine kinase